MNIGIPNINFEKPVLVIAPSRCIVDQLEKELLEVPFLFSIGLVKDDQYRYTVYQVTMTKKVSQCIRSAVPSSHRRFFRTQYPAWTEVAETVPKGKSERNASLNFMRLNGYVEPLPSVHFTSQPQKICTKTCIKNNKEAKKYMKIAIANL